MLLKYEILQMEDYTTSKARALSAFHELADETDIDSAHSGEHASIVMSHCTMALNAAAALGSGQQRSCSALEKLAVEVAGALHDADDAKFFDTPPGHYTNARMILERIFPVCDYGAAFHEQVIRYISCVSCSTNGNSVPDDCDPVTEPWWNYARLADRAEAIGGIGVLRAYVYTLHVDRPLFTDGTPLVTNDKELTAVVTNERFDGYLRKKKSATFIDHFYDKMFHIADFDQYTDNPYLRELARKRLDEMKAFIFSFGNNPTEQNILRWIAKFKVQYGTSIRF